MSCLTFKPISYGNFSFANYPLYSKVTVTPVKSDDNVSIKYYKTVFEVKFILANPNGLDFDLDAIKTQLLTRGLEFHFEGRGFGSNVTLNAPGATIQDINYGPIPEILEWNSLGADLAAEVTWRLEANTTACPITPDLSVSSAVQFAILSLVEDTELTFDEEGAAIITTSGYIEVAGQSVSFVTPNNLKKFAAFFDKNQLTNFQRTSKINVRRDNRTIDYQIVDTEIKSDNPFGQYMITQDVTHSISSTLISDNIFEGSGFKTWANDMAGEFTVRPGVWKGFAWVAFALYLANRRNRASVFGAPVDRFAKDDKPQNDKKKILSKQIPLSVRIKESLNSRRVSVNVRWVTYTSILNLFKATGMFYPVDTRWIGVPLNRIPDNILAATPESKEFQWQYWKTSVGGVQGRTGYRNPQLPTFPMIFNVCTADQTTISTNRQTNYQSQNVNPEPVRPSNTESEEYQAMPLGKTSYEGSSYGSYLDNVTPEVSWIDYQVRKSLVEYTNSSYLPTIESQYLSTRRATNLDSSNKSAVGFGINGAASSADQTLYNNDIVQIRGKPIYTVRFSGYALRLGYEIPCPIVTSVNDRPCYRVGQNKWSCDLVGVSDEIPVYLAKWSSEYAIQGTPESNQISFETSGRPAEFS